MTDHDHSLRACGHPLQPGFDSEELEEDGVTDPERGGGSSGRS